MDESSFVDGVSSGLVANVIYDAFVLSLAFIFVKVVYEKIYMNLRWGKWKVSIINSKSDTTRILTSQKARSILSDDGEFSVYVKGIVASTGTWLNVDIASEKAKELELVKIDHKKREIQIDVDKNPQKPKVPNQMEIKINKLADDMEKLLNK